jgi:hypothetical protein
VKLHDDTGLAARRQRWKSLAAHVRPRFTKPGHWAEIRERKVTQFRGIEFLVFVDGSLLESQMFHNGREVEYPGAIEERLRQFIDGGWTETIRP